MRPDSIPMKGLTSCEVFMRKFSMSGFSSDGPAPVAVCRATICIGDVLKDGGYPQSISYKPSVEILNWTALVALLSQNIHPKVVYSATMSDRFDCLDLAELLHRFEYTGNYRILVENVPNPELIRSEIGALCPGLQFELERTLPTELMQVL